MNFEEAVVLAQLLAERNTACSGLSALHHGAGDRADPPEAVKQSMVSLADAYASADYRIRSYLGQVGY